jgi:hypothetical protein
MMSQNRSSTSENTSTPAVLATGLFDALHALSDQVPREAIPFFFAIPGLLQLLCPEVSGLPGSAMTTRYEPRELL